MKHGVIEEELGNSAEGVSYKDMQLWELSEYDVKWLKHKWPPKRKSGSPWKGAWGDAWSIRTRVADGAGRYARVLQFTLTAQLSRVHSIIYVSKCRQAHVQGRGSAQRVSVNWDKIYQKINKHTTCLSLEKLLPLGTWPNNTKTVWKPDNWAQKEIITVSRQETITYIFRKHDHAYVNFSTWPLDGNILPKIALYPSLTF